MKILHPALHVYTFLSQYHFSVKMLRGWGGVEGGGGGGELPLCSPHTTKVQTEVYHGKAFEH